MCVYVAAIMPRTDPNISYWRVVEKNALEALDQATGRTSLNAAARQLMRARAELKRLEWRIGGQIRRVEETAF